MATLVRTRRIKTNHGLSRNLIKRRVYSNQTETNQETQSIRENENQLRSKPIEYNTKNIQSTQPIKPNRKKFLIPILVAIAFISAFFKIIKNK